MENFIVSARKYRPVTFDTVVGQSHITDTLKNAIKNNHLAQSFLFCGPRGVGKTTCARILAKTINCFQPKSNIEPCDECPSCKSFNESSSFNIHELDAASNNSVDDIRSLIDKVRIPPQVGKYKIYIIDEVHMLSAAAFNAFLKTLEEPPTYAKFILATTEKHKIIPTILSRCQIFDFKRITIDDIAKHLAFVAHKENVSAEQDALHVIAQKADGALRDALSIFDQIVSFAGDNVSYSAVIDNLNVLDYDYYFQVTRYLVEGDILGAIAVFNKILYKGFDTQHFLSGLGEHLRNLLVCKDVSTLDLLEVGENIKVKYKEQSDICSLKFLAKSLDIFNKADVQYMANRNKRLLIEIALMQIAAINSDLFEDNSKEVAQVKTVNNIQPLVVEDKSLRNSVKPNLRHDLNSKTQINSSATIDKKTVVSARISATPISKGFKTSLFAIPSQNKKVEDEDKNIHPSNLVDKKENYDFTQEELEKVWNMYAETLQKEAPSFYSTLKCSQPTKKDNIVNFVIFNKAQESDFNQRKNEIVGFLREKLCNYNVSLNLVLDAVVVETKPYTFKEKYQQFIMKNPQIEVFRKELGLSFEY